MPHTEAGLATARLSNQQESTGGVGLSEGLAPPHSVPLLLQRWAGV